MSMQGASLTAATHLASKSRESPTLLGRTDMARPRTTKNSIEQALYDRYGGYMTVADTMKELGATRPTAMKFLATLPSYSPTGKRAYRIEDVARKIVSSRAEALEV